MTDLRPERADLWPVRADSRSKGLIPGFRHERADDFCPKKS